MKRYKVREILKMLADDGWYLKRQRGSHRQFGHPIKKRIGNSKREAERYD